MIFSDLFFKHFKMNLLEILNFLAQVIMRDGVRLLNITILISGASLLIDVTYHRILKASLNNLNFVRNTFDDHE